eukprot:1145561-Pelagomonas_calceolata.AAC.4
MLRRQNWEVVVGRMEQKKARQALHAQASGNVEQANHSRRRFQPAAYDAKQQHWALPSRLPLSAAAAHKLV